MSARRRLLNFLALCFRFLSPSARDEEDEGEEETSSRPPISMNPDWSTLPRDGLELISRRLSYDVDYVRFRSVCSSWRAAAPHRPQLPWLARHGLDEGGVLTVSSFSSISPDGRVSPLPLLDTPPGLLCCGSSHGWLALLAPTRSLALFNPITRSTVQLPAFDDFPDAAGYKFSQVGDRYLSHRGDGTNRRTKCFDRIDRYFASKVILSSHPEAAGSDCVALVARCWWRRLSFCRPGDDSWTLIPFLEFKGFIDMLFYKGRFYVACRYRIYVCDVGVSLPTMEEVPSAISMYEHLMLRDVDECYLVECSGDLLLVNVYYGSWHNGRRNYRVKVFKVELEERVRLLELESFGDHALFLGRNQSFSVPASRFPGCKANCVYLAEYYRRNMTEVRVINVENGSDTVLPNEVADLHSHSEPCAWFTPSLL